MTSKEFEITIEIIHDARKEINTLLKTGFISDQRNATKTLTGLNRILRQLEKDFN